MENQTQDPRWINPLIDQNIQMRMATSQQQDAAQQPQDQPQNSEDQDKYEQVRQAMLFIQQMKQRGVDNRTTQEQSKYKQAVQIVAKNPDISQQLSNK